MKKTLANITVDQKNKAIKQLRIKNQSLSFKCKRCAILCCKLGGPPITKKDAEILENSGYSLEQITEPLKRKFKLLPFNFRNLKNKNNGSCIFLEYDQEKNQFKCTIYEIDQFFADYTHLDLNI